MGESRERSRRHDPCAGDLAASIPRACRSTLLVQVEGTPLGDSAAARSDRIRAHDRGRAHHHAAIDGAPLGRPRGHERRDAGAVLSRRRQFDLLSADQAADHAQSRQRPRRALLERLGIAAMANLMRTRREQAGPTGTTPACRISGCPTRQMKTAPPPLRGRAHARHAHRARRRPRAGRRHRVAGGRPATATTIRTSSPRSAPSSARMPHVMFGGLVHEPALTLATRLAAMLPGDLDRVFFSDSGSVAVEVAMKMATQYWLNRGVAGGRSSSPSAAAITATPSATMAVCDPDEGMHSLFAGAPARAATSSICRATRPAAPRFDTLLERHADELAGILVEPLVQGAGGMLFHDERRAAPPARGRRQLRPAADLRRDLHRLRPHRRPCSPAKRRASRPTSSRCQRR